jgi:integrase
LQDGMSLVFLVGQQVLFGVDWVSHRGHKEPCLYIHTWRLFILTSLRCGELCGLRVSRSMTSTGAITDGKTVNARRYIMLSERMNVELEAQKALLKSFCVISPWVFPARDGGMVQPNNVYRQWRIYCRQHGIASSIHELRHTMISIVKSDIPEPLLKQVVGHSKSMDTGLYQHVVRGDAEKASTLIDNVFNRIFETKCGK